jgi:PIN domain nuclease of toxin-antitoxin system
VSSSRLLDASALLALVFREPGHEIVAEACPATICAANLSEVVAKLVDRGAPPGDAATAHQAADLEVIQLTEEVAIRAGHLRSATRAVGLSLGDRCCLATAQLLSLEVLTADAAWESLAAELGLTITNIRPRGA